MSKAVELFTAVPRQHNCAQAVAAGFDREDLTAGWASCGSGRETLISDFCWGSYLT